MKILVRKYRDFVVDVVDASTKTFFDASKMKEMEVDPNDFKEISPEELKQLIEETKEKLKREIELDLRKAKEKLGGKVFDFLDLTVLSKDDAELIKTVLFFSRKYLEVIAFLENHELFHDLEAYKEFYDNAKNWEPDENRIYVRKPYIDVDTECDYDEAYIEGIKYVCPYMEIRTPDDKWLYKVAALDVIFKNVNPAVRYNCEAIKDYMNGDLTFKGFVKKISLVNELSC